MVVGFGSDVHGCRRWQGAAAGDQQQPIRLTNVPATNPEISPDGTLLLCRLQVAETSKVTLLGAAGDVAPRYFDFHHYSGAGTRWMPDQTAYLTVDTRDGVQNIF